jgi:transcriptional regulator with XRE-family HTH domain
MDIGTSIKSIRKKLGITQYELAERCNLSQTSLSQIETGLKRPSTKTINKICDVLEIPESIIYLLAMQDVDIPETKKDIYKMVYPSIKSLALQIVDAKHLDLVSA